jgi:vancomycin permeability regulator SanA
MGESFDYFVIFGAAVRPDGRPSAVLRHRVESAYRLAEGRSRARFLVTGGLGRHPPAECEVMRDLLIEHGAPPEAVVTEGEGHSTLSSAIRCARILAARGDARSVTVCSSSYHLPRCWLLMRVLGVRARKARLASDRSWLGNRRWLRACLREAAATPWGLLRALGTRVSRSDSSECRTAGEGPRG